MRQEAFVRSREERWGAFESQLESLDRGERGGPEFPRSYRLVCQDLALARDRGFATSIVDRLNGLALRGHQNLYGVRARRVGVVAFLARQFPQAVRREARLFWLTTLLFYGSALLVFSLDLNSPSLVYNLLSADQVAEFEVMYDPAAPHYGTPRGTVGDFSAFTFYVSNNIGVSLRTFAWGVFCGLGSLLILTFNGISLGLVSAHITLAGHALPFFSFVIGHGALELTAIVLSGVAGMKIGGTLLAPGRLTRLTALRIAARETVPILYGMMAMLLAAAVIEAFWSSSSWIPPRVKLAVGGGLWLSVSVWLGFGGRRRADR